MDSIISTALDEVCAEGPGGVAFPELWPMLQACVSSAGLDVRDAYVRAAIWRRLLVLRGIRFEAKGGVAVDSKDPSIQSLEDAERNVTRVVAEEPVGHAFLGISELRAAGREIPTLQIRLLERVARARTNGVRQADLSKEFEMKPRDFHYHLKVIESYGLVVRQTTLVKDGTKHTNTNTVYFHRYSRHLSLSSTQRVEITKGDREGEDQEEPDGCRLTEDSCDLGAQTSKEEVCLKDFIPKMEAICNMLEQASGKVLVVSDLKRELGYRATAGHRAWRHILHMLIEAKLVESFNAKLSDHGKAQPCLRLLNKLNRRDFQPKVTRYSADSGMSNNANEPCHISERVVELPIDHQIYDMIDAQGPDGISIKEVCKRLGLSNKKHHTQITSMCSRFGMHLRSKLVNKNMSYWVSTAANMKDCVSSASNDSNFENPHSLESFDPKHPAGELKGSVSDKASTIQAGLVSENSHLGDSRAIVPHFDMNVEECGNRNDSNGCEEDMPSKIRTDKRYPCLDASDVTLQRKQRILSRLENEKFVLQAELHKWLETLETDKPTKTDKKTLLRILKKLKHEGRCKFVKVSFPSFTKRSSERSEMVILHPSVSDVSELSGIIHEKVKDFDYICRSHSLPLVKSNNQNTTLLTNVERLSNDVSRVQASHARALRANGFIPSKMVRAKLLHVYLWSHVNTSGMEMYCNSLKLNLKAAIIAMPVELYLQIAGSIRKVDDFISYCQQGLKLSELPDEECKSLMETLATSRLAATVDILIRLKLISVVMEDFRVDAGHAGYAALTHALELKPYIEQPRGRDSSDHRPRVRHDFVFSSRDSVDAYWQTLEDCYATADPKIACHAFPGSAVVAVALRRSWCTLRVMSMEQRLKLSKHLTSSNLSKKISSTDCINIARELNLSPDQVLRASYHMQQSCKLSSGCNADGHEISKRRSAKKRKRSPINDHDIDFQRIRQPLLKADEEVLEPETCVGKSQDVCMSENAAELVAEDDNDNYDIISACTFKVMNSRRRRFQWNDESDRQLIIQYARYLATHGANFHRVDWHSLPDLPATPKSCKRRMALLKKSTPVRNAVMIVCNVLSERYAKYIDDTSMEVFEENDNPTEIRSSNVTNMDRHMTGGSWDNFEDPKLKMAIDKVLQCKKFDKLGISTENESVLERKYTDKFSVNVADSLLPAPSDRENHCAKNQKDFKKLSLHGRKKKRCLPIPGRVLELLNSTDVGITKQVADSLSLSSAVELIKLVFLSNSEAAEVQTFLVETLKRYAKSDIFAAVTYLKEKKFMVPGHGKRPFVLSQKFINDASSSPYPFDTGRRSAKFSSLILNKKESFVFDGLDCPLDLQCGEILHLFALVALDEATLSICMPEEGVGDVDEPIASKQNEKINNGDEIRKAEVLWMKDSEFCLRKEKGFPGIKVAMDHSCSNFECINSSESSGSAVTTSLSKCSTVISSTSIEHSCTLESIQESSDPCSKSNLSGSIWQTMVDYTQSIMPDALTGQTINSDLIESVYYSVKQSGEQGLSIEEIAKAVVVHGNLYIDIIIDTLVAFQKVVKVNAYDSVRVIDSSYRLKFYIPMLPSHDKNVFPVPRAKRHRVKRAQDEGGLGHGKIAVLPQSHSGTDTNLGVGHKVSILDLPEETEDLAEPLTLSNDCLMEEDFPTDKSPCLARPILPWVSGDGSTNNIIYKGLVRRILGTVMQNPGILEEDLISFMDVLNPQSCRQLLELLILDNHISVRKIYQTPTVAPPILLEGLIESNVEKSEPLFRKHLFANPLSTHYL